MGNDDGVRLLVLAELRAIADRFTDDGTDRATRMAQAIQHLDAAGALADPMVAMSFAAFAWHLADGLDPKTHASQRARLASDRATLGDRILRSRAWGLAEKHKTAPSRAEIVRRIMPELHQLRDMLAAQGIKAAGLSGERAHRTVSDWLKNRPKE